MDGSKMLKEIREQPEVLGRVLDEGWGRLAPRRASCDRGVSAPRC